MQFIVLLVRVVLALIFVVAGLAKLADLIGSRQALCDFGEPAFLAPPCASSGIGRNAYRISRAPHIIFLPMWPENILSPFYGHLTNEFVPFLD